MRAATPLLLSREVFKHQVFERSGGACVFCGEPAVDAHHILERKLFEDGGYYLDNGAAVCNPCHWKCETTEYSVEQVRQASGIEQVCLPPGLASAGTYDKWGNRLWPSGLRTLGALAQDDGMLRALAAGGMRSWLMPADYREG
jgi:hypothetical protein